MILNRLAKLKKNVENIYELLEKKKEKYYENKMKKTEKRTPNWRSADISYENYPTWIQIDKSDFHKEYQHQQQEQQSLQHLIIGSNRQAR